ncbi:hypothetical protein WN944_014842 [Citrus x changshan-huyou]|uniref:Retrotransposon gag domain-containing protein n=1 Tax=Citrus x changshan-huyou TaxID=2935761 RepID=A0AAP0MCU7_9ROSI
MLPKLQHLCGKVDKMAKPKEANPEDLPLASLHSLIANLHQPHQALKNYKAQTTIKVITNNTICCSFPHTVKDAAKAWFKSHHTISVSSWEQLQWDFLTQF